MNAPSRLHEFQLPLDPSHDRSLRLPPLDLTTVLRERASNERSINRPETTPGSTDEGFLDTKRAAEGFTERAQASARPHRFQRRNPSRPTQTHPSPQGYRWAEMKHSTTPVAEGINLLDKCSDTGHEVNLVPQDYQYRGNHTEQPMQSNCCVRSLDYNRVSSISSQRIILPDPQTDSVGA